MAGVQFNPDDDPSFNSFDLPTICSGVDSAERSCCDPCAEWLFCLRRTPIAVTLPGLDLSRWLPCVSFCCNRVLQSSGIGGTLSGGGEADVFSGTFLTLSASESFTRGNCGTRGETLLCDTSWADDGSGGGDLLVSHSDLLGRTIYAPGAAHGQVKALRLAVRTECVLNEDDEQCLKFSVVLVFGYERAATINLGGCETDDGTPICDPAAVNEIEADAAWDAGSCIEVGCCVVAESALIPIAGLTLGDLATVTLTPVPPPDWELVDPMEPTGPWQLASGSYQCGAYFVGFVKEVPYAASGCSPEVEAECGSGSFGGYHDLGNDGCEHPDEGDAKVWAEKSQPPHAALRVWVPPPITMNAGSASLSVLVGTCLPPGNCGSCVPDPEKPHVAVPIIPGENLKFSVSGSGCNKTFTPVFPACADIVSVYWPWGEVSSGDDPVTHTIENLAEDGVSKEESSKAVFVSSTGCVYCYTETVTCGCCPGTSGSLTATSTGLNVFDLCATTNGTPESGPCAGQETVIVWTGEDVTPASGTLGNGDCQEIEVTGDNPTITWRTVDGQECEGDPSTIRLWRVTCACCTKPINGVRVTIGGWIAFDALVCARCNEFNQTYELHPDAGVEFTCLWKYQTALGDGPNIVCRDPSEEEPLGYIVGREIFFTIECHDDILRLIVYANMSEGTAIYYKDFACPGCDAGLNPADCQAIIGDTVELDLDALGILGTAPVVAGCDPMPSTCVVEIDWGT